MQPGTYVSGHVYELYCSLHDTPSLQCWPFALVAGGSERAHSARANN